LWGWGKRTESLRPVLATQQETQPQKNFKRKEQVFEQLFCYWSQLSSVRLLRVHQCIIRHWFQSRNFLRTKLYNPLPKSLAINIFKVCIMALVRRKGLLSALPKCMFDHIYICPNQDCNMLNVTCRIKPKFLLSM
jgi:hypothetical protein